MQPIHYETKQAILEEAGLSQIVNGEVLAGAIDGTNLVFNTIYKPITDSNDDDQIDTTDIMVYVNHHAEDCAGHWNGGDMRLPVQPGH
jgi:hypothetical protein